MQTSKQGATKKQTRQDSIEVSCAVTLPRSSSWDAGWGRRGASIYPCPATPAPRSLATAPSCLWRDVLVSLTSHENWSDTITYSIPLSKESMTVELDLPKKSHCVGYCVAPVFVKCYQHWNAWSGSSKHGPTVTPGPTEEPIFDARLTNAGHHSGRGAGRGLRERAREGVELGVAQPQSTRRQRDVTFLHVS